jgi:hypothetical protein
VTYISGTVRGVLRSMAQEMVTREIEDIFLELDYLRDEVRRMKWQIDFNYQTAFSAAYNGQNKVVVMAHEELDRIVGRNPDHAGWSLIRRLAAMPSKE